jgi:pyruvate/2-oxoglutarate dehydrogenase complex dihydrolipoamide dehydrogenase (E3) component
LHRASHQAWFASVGLAEQKAHARGIAHEVTKYPLHQLDRATVGEYAGELIAEYVFAMTHGLGLNKILGTIHAYPTMAEANKFAAGVWNKKARH